MDVNEITNMIVELEEEIKKFDKNLDRQYPHPAAKWLFKTKPNSKPIAEQKNDIY